MVPQILYGLHYYLRYMYHYSLASTVWYLLVHLDFIDSLTKMDTTWADTH